jgi:preprotein translocase subunit SecF
MGKHEAIAQAVRTRFRPLIATSLTSIVALIPLALTDPFWQSLSVTLIFGLLSSTFLVIIAFPYYLLVGEWLREFGRRGWRRQLSKGVQLIFDIISAPLRVVSFIFWVVFSWRK